MAPTTTKIKASSTYGTVQTPEQEIPRALIFVDDAWNARSAKSDALAEKGSALVAETENTDTDQGSTGIAGLADSIAAVGQDQAVLLRPNPNPKTAKEFPYALVAGFRRTHAIDLIAARAIATKTAHPIAVYPQWDPAKPTIRAVVKPMTEAEARMANLRENTARDNLSGPDLCAAVTQLFHDFKKEKAGEARGGKAAIAAGLDKAVRYVGKLIDIGVGMPPETIAHWRIATKPLPYVTMLQCLLVDPERRKEEYERCCNAGRALPGGAGAAGDGWIEAAKAKAEGIGKMFGLAEALGELESGTCDGIEWGNILADGGPKDPGLLGVKKGASNADRSALADAFRTGVKAGFLAISTAAALRKEEEEKKASGAKDAAAKEIASLEAKAAKEKAAAEAKVAKEAADKAKADAKAIADKAKADAKVAADKAKEAAKAAKAVTSVSAKPKASHVATPPTDGAPGATDGKGTAPGAGVTAAATN